MSRKASILLNIITFAVSLLACGSWPHAPNKSSTAVDQGLNVLIVVKGEVQLKRDGWKDYHSTAFGAELHPGDLLQPGKDSKVVVLCADLTTRNVPQGISSGLITLCPQPPEPALTLDNSRFGNTRGGIDPLIPYVISPRATGLLSGTPTLRWNSSPGATNYIVQIKEGQDLIWKNETSNTQMDYPGQPSLKPDVTYLLIIETDNGMSSQDEGIAGLGFHLLSEDEIHNVQRDAVRLAGLDLPEEAKVYALAQLYAGRGLTAEAIELLEALVYDGSHTPAIYRILGHLYQNIGLTLQAESRYRKAVELTDTTVDLEGLAASQAGLGLAYATLGNKVEAIYWLEEARDGFNELGDALRASEIENQLDNLQ